MRPRVWIKHVMALAAAALLGAVWLTSSLSQAQDKKPPETIVFETKMGNVTFQHAKHIERVDNDCTACHTKLFPQSRAPLEFKAKMHQTAEAAKTSCAGCHHPGGMAFATKGKCKTCHVK